MGYQITGRWMSALTMALLILSSSAHAEDPYDVPEEVLNRTRPGPKALAAAGKADEQEFLNMFARGYAPAVAGQVVYVPRPGYYWSSGAVSFDHGSPWRYDVHTPLMLYGPKIVKARTVKKRARPQDLTATVTRALRSPPPPGMEGRVWDEVLQAGASRPKVVLTVVMDQTGYADVMRFAKTMPTLHRMRRRGAWFENCQLDYLPSATAVTHSTIGTGATPSRHGVVANKIAKGKKMAIILRSADGGAEPNRLLVPTLADWYDRLMGNRSVVISQVFADYAAIGMAGHGASFPGGDKDIVVYYDSKSGAHVTDERYYRIPEYVARKHVSDLYKNGKLMAHGFDAATPGRVRLTRQFARFQTDNLMQMMVREGVGQDDIPDLIYANLKTTDNVGHHLGHDHPAYQEALAEVDSLLRRCEAYFKKTAGDGGYLIALTADHGVCPEDGVRVNRDAWGKKLGRLLDARGDRDGETAVIGVEQGRIYLDLDELKEEGSSVAGFRDLVKRQKGILHAWTEQEVIARAVELAR